jgi:hypothetical protein
MSGLIYLRHGDQLVPMTESTYDTEDDLQRLLADYPDLLAGEQINSTAPRRWLLIAREALVPDQEGGAGRWALDHLFLDQDGVPTLVEVKRSSDSRIRREVVGQMLDYAANAVVCWPIEALRSRFDAACEQRGVAPEAEIAQALGFDGDIDSFWQLVRTNLQAGRVRMVFVADVVPPELRRVVEFLNGQMTPAEVLAVEVRQYVGQGQQALVPRVIGQTQRAVSQKAVGGAASESRQWDEPSFLRELSDRAGVPAAETASKLLDWARERGLRISRGAAPTQGWVFPMLDHKGSHNWVFSAVTTGRIGIEFGSMRSTDAFRDDAKRLELLGRLNAIGGIQITEDRISKFPRFRIAVLEDDAALQQFLSVMDWVVEEIRRT